MLSGSDPFITTLSNTILVIVLIFSAPVTPVRVYIKNMVCLRCKLLVQDEIERLDLEYDEVKMGEAVIKDPVSP